ncbi:MAG TPA: hypothetical protein VHS96_02030 [Bacteroidia bacterium]|nr:hypothetical protein [Bacteroidia bacterium]
MRKLSAFMTVLLLLVLTFAASDLQAQKRRFRVTNKDAGFSMIPEVAALIPSNTYKGAINFNLIAGAQLGPHWFVGGGVALDAYNTDFYVPIFADARYFFMDKPLSPFAYIDAGYGLPVDAASYLKGGPMVNPGFGIKYFMTRSTAVCLSLGYRYQSMPVDVSDPDASTALRTNYIQSLSLRVGLQF